MDSIRDPYSSTYTLNSTLPVGSDCQDIVVPVPVRGKNGAGYKAQNMAHAQGAQGAQGSQGAGADSLNSTPGVSQGFTTMTPQQIAQWIDRRSRLVFPISFVVFNILYWGFVWI